MITNHNFVNLFISKIGGGGGIHFSPFIILSKEVNINFHLITHDRGILKNDFHPYMLYIKLELVKSYMLISTTDLSEITIKREKIKRIINYFVNIF